MIEIKDEMSMSCLSRFHDKRDAEDAMDALDGRMYDGRDLRIQMAKYGRPEPSER